MPSPLPRPLRLSITALGFHLANLPLDARLGKMLVVASVLGCLDPVLTVCAALGHKSPFLKPNGRDAAARSEAAKGRFAPTGSDHIAIAQVVSPKSGGGWRFMSDGVGWVNEIVVIFLAS
jgi:HrpA-like RNA helicase